MTKELRRLSIVVLAMFLALFVSTSWIQVVNADALGDDPHNTRAVYDGYQVQRGAILTAGTPIAYSVPSDDVYSFQRVYPDGTLWAPVTGVAPILGAPTGLEQKMNDVLSGSSGTQFFQRVEQIVSGQSPRGSNIEISLDADLQRVASEALGDYEGAVVALEPSTGRVLAMVSSPGYDTNLLVSHDNEQVEETYQQLLDDPQNPLYNRTISGDLYPPGSTFKLVLAAAALSSGQYTPASPLPNQRTWQLPGSSSVVSNHDGQTCGPGETVTLADAVRLSCNVPLAQLAVQLGDDAIREQAELFGFNQGFSIPLDVTASSYPRAVGDAETALTGFGQGPVTATPLQMAMVSAAIANHGVVMKPRMVDRIIAPDLAVQDAPADEQLDQALDERLAAQLREMMVAGVRDGAASGARIDGIDVAGKTGTAENDEDDPYTFWFTGFAPAQNPRIAVAVVVENGAGMGQAGLANDTVAPIARKVMEAVVGR